MRSFFALSLVLIAAAGANTPAAFAADPCAGFKWDVSKEHALFGGTAQTLATGKNAASAPAIDVSRLYQLELTPQDQVTFALPPGKRMLADGAYAGLATFKIKAAGAYRVSVDVPFWIDVIEGGKLVATKNFTGAQGCEAPHKIVEYELAGGQPLVLQVSGSTKASVRLTVTPTPPGGGAGGGTRMGTSTGGGVGTGATKP